LDESQVAAEILRATIFVSASHMDNSPNSVAEAMALGAPVVATAVGGVPEMLEQGEAGVLVPPSRPEELAGALDQLLRHPEQAARLSARAQIVARSRHDAGRVVAQLRDAYHQALS
jgi:glycosyltransferase involved in cell wall biosynthesis